MRSTRDLVTIALTLAVMVSVAGPAAAQAPELTETVSLTAHDGATAKVPAWTRVRGDASVAIYEKAPDVRRDPSFYVVMVAIEEGPTGEVAWDQIQNNIQKASSTEGRRLDLALVDPYKGNAAFEARMMRGTFANSDGKQVEIGLVAMVKDGKMVTVSLMTKTLDEPSLTILSAIADSVTLAP